jgi:broad specificity phosphatase PhoE
MRSNNRGATREKETVEVDVTTRVFLVRHGETSLAAEDRFAGSTDVPLGPNGYVQTEKLADRLAQVSFAAVYASPMQRAIETATILARRHGLEVGVRDGLQELNHGHWEGLRRADVESKFPDEYSCWVEDPFTFAPDGGETGVHVVARALPVIREIVVSHSGESVLIVSHKATIRLLIASLLGFDARGYRDRLDQSPASLTVLDFKDPVRARLMLFNDVSHYSAQPLAQTPRLSHW